MANGTEQIISPISAIMQWLVTSVAQSIPRILAAVIILLIGWIIASVIGKIIEQILKQVKVDKWLREHGVTQAIFNISVEETVVAAFKWYIALLFIQEAVLRVGLTTLSNFFGSIIIAIPHILVGVAIIIISLILGGWIKAQIEKTRVRVAEMVGGIVYVFVVYIGVVLALPKFGFADTTILTETFRLFVGGLAVGTAIAIGIGFGFAIKEGPAKAVIKEIVRETRPRK